MLLFYLLTPVSTLIIDKCMNSVLHSTIIRKLKRLSTLELCDMSFVCVQYVWNRFTIRSFTTYNLSAWHVSHTCLSLCVMFYWLCLCGHPYPLGWAFCWKSSGIAESEFYCDCCMLSVLQLQKYCTSQKYGGMANILALGFLMVRYEPMNFIG